jgi:acetolactate synthase-1/2/3 large subunit
MSRAMGGAGEIVEDPASLGDHIAQALASGRPTVLDVRIDSEVRPLSAATWDLPPLPHPEPAFGWPDAES